MMTKGSALVLISAFLLAASSVEARGRQSTNFVVATATPTPTPWKYNGCVGDPQPFKDGPWDETDYSLARTGTNASADLYCGSLEICFAIDESGSMKANNFQMEIQFVRKLMSKLVTRTHVLHPANYSAWLFDGKSQTLEHQISPLTPAYQSVLSKLNVAGYDGGCTNIAAGLRNCAAELTNGGDGSKVIILLSDGAQSVDANNNGVYNVQEEDAHVQLLAQDLKNAGITILTLELYQQSVGQAASLTRFLKDLASNRADGSPRFFDSTFEELVANEILADVMSGGDGVCDPDIVGPTPADVVGDMCTCSETVDLDSPSKAESEQLTLTEVTGPATGICSIKLTTPKRYVCDMDSNDHVCRLVEGKGWVRAVGSDGRPLPPRPDGTVECKEVNTVKTVFVQDV